MPRFRAYPLLFVGPLTLFLIVFLVLPFVTILVLSFFTHSPTRIYSTDLTTANYAYLARDTFLTILVRTLRIGLASTLLCALFGYPLAYILARAERRAKAVGMFFLMMPLMVSAVIRTFGWVVILGRRGLVNKTLETLGIGSLPLLYNETAVVIGLASVSLPFMALPLMASIERINPATEEAARNLGATWTGMFARVILPQSLPGLFSGSLLVYSTAVSSIVIPSLMGGSRVNVVAKLIFDQLLISFQWPSASAIATAFMLATLVLSYLAVTVTRRRGEREVGA